MRKKIPLGTGSNALFTTTNGSPLFMKVHFGTDPLENIITLTGFFFLIFTVSFQFLRYIQKSSSACCKSGADSDNKTVSSA